MKYYGFKPPPISADLSKNMPSKWYVIAQKGATSWKLIDENENELLCPSVYANNIIGVDKNVSIEFTLNQKINSNASIMIGFLNYWDLINFLPARESGINKNEMNVNGHCFIFGGPGPI